MKTVEEWSNAFDVLLSDKQIELALNEYEKSVFLTNAQEELVLSLYSGASLNSYFEKDESARKHLDSLLVSEKLSLTASDEISDSFLHYNATIPENCMYSVYEQALTDEQNNCGISYILDVVPVTHDEYNKVIKNPFKWPTSTRVLRLDDGDKSVELVSKIPLTQYYLRYLSKPSPIILVNLSSEGLTIEGESTAQTCTLPEPLHRSILNYAVQLAIKAKITETK